jgi:hypothetical protein
LDRKTPFAWCFYEIIILSGLELPLLGAAMLATLTVEKNAYEVALENFDLAADGLDLDGSVRAMIQYLERILEVTIPVAWIAARSSLSRIPCNTARGPAKGGIRFHPECDRG